MLKLDLGSGAQPRPGYEGVDLYCPVRYRFDLLTFPWPLEDSSVEEIVSSHYFEHVPGLQRAPFMEEVYRVLRPGARATFITPHWTSERAIQDPTHAWPPLCHASYQYFDKAWHTTFGLDHPPYPTCDFEITPPHNKLEDSYQQRTPEYQAFAGRHYLNIIEDFTITLISRKKAPAPPPVPPDVPA